MQWDKKELRFYDSLPDRSDAVKHAKDVEEAARALLLILECWLNIHCSCSEWKWVAEQV
jgi:hypothetical protein